MLRLRFAAALCAAAVVAPAAAQSPAPGTAAAPVVAPVEQAALSPSGARLAVVRQTSGYRQLEVQSLTGEGLGLVALGRAPVGRADFIDEDRVLLTVTGPAELDAGAPVSLTRAHVYDVRSRRLTTMMHDTPNAMKAVFGEPQVVGLGGNLALLVRGVTRTSDGEDRIDLYRVDPNSGRGRIVEPGVKERRTHWVATAHGQVVARSVHGPGDAWTLEAKAGDAWLPATRGRTVSPEPQIPALGRTDGSVRLRARDEGLLQITLADGRTTRLATEPVVMSLSEATTGLYAGYVRDREDERTVFADPARAAVWAKVQRGFRGRDPQAVDWSTDFGRLLIRADTGGGESLYVVDMRTLKADLLAPLRPSR